MANSPEQLSKVAIIAKNNTKRRKQLHVCFPSSCILSLDPYSKLFQMRNKYVQFSVYQVSSKGSNQYKVSFVVNKIINKM